MLSVINTITNDCYVVDDTERWTSLTTKHLTMIHREERQLQHFHRLSLSAVIELA